MEIPRLPGYNNHHIFPPSADTTAIIFHQNLITQGDTVMGVEGPVAGTKDRVLHDVWAGGARGDGGGMLGQVRIGSSRNAFYLCTTPRVG